eukprot:TRINITY_DN17259_c0_g1_i1.p1 TRINITY_DN17259_c0_g1~~TRINITY_DN17259_c0_g1_i1.p1  ORF type:complete len:982 (-),score=195.92 TRINITY_DN17259_c0_g1_i1:184-3129(-)
MADVEAESGSSSGQLTEAAFAAPHLLVAAWAGLWVLGHFVFWPLWNAKKKSCNSAVSSVPLEKYRRRLCRSQVYCFLASVGGLHLLYYRCRWTAKDLLYGYSPEHEFLFAMAAAHWLVSVWEDASSWRYLSGGVGIKDFADGSVDPNNILFYAYMVHHLAAGLGYVAIMYNRSCVGVGIFGLTFELPVLLMNHREFTVYADRPPDWFRSLDKVTSFWTLLGRTFLVARFGPSFVYFYSWLYWREDILALPTFEAMVYHGMALFFTGLNWVLFNTFLVLWMNLDKKKASKEQGYCFQRSSAMDERGPGIDESVSKVRGITLDVLEKHDGMTADDGEVWVLVDKVVYNVTDYMREHPGGVEILLKHAGKDASEAFHKARHSHNAKMKMSSFVLGPIQTRPTRYRIFEHNGELKETFKEAFMSMHLFGAFSLFLSFTAVLEDGMLTKDDTLSTAVVPGCALAMISSAFMFFYMLLTGACGFTCLSGRSLFIGAAFLAQTIGMVMVRQPLPSGGELQKSCPTGLELAVGAILGLQDWMEFVSRPSKFQGSTMTLVGPGMMLGGWFYRGALDLWQVAYWQLVGAAMLAWSVLAISGNTGLARESANRQALGIQILNGVFMAGPMAVVVLTFATSSGVRAEAVLQSIRGQSWWNLLLVLGAANLSTVSCLMFCNCSFVTSQAWATRLYALAFFLPVLLWNGFFELRWLFVFGVILWYGDMNYRLRQKLEEAAERGEFEKVAVWRIGTQALWDQIRVSTTIVIWRILSAQIVKITKFILPAELTVYACEIPIFNLGENVDLGFTAYFGAKTKPPTNAPMPDKPGEEVPSLRTDDPRPEFYVCNVGHIDTSNTHGLNDIQRTMNALRDVWSEFEREPPRGFVANIVAVFPYIQGTTTCKEVNLSVWERSEDAHKWYYDSEGHRKIMCQHTGGFLRTFGNLLASLQPTEAVRFQDRCQRCSRLVESKTPGEPPPARCTLCGARTFDYPLF